MSEATDPSRDAALIADSDLFDQGFYENRVGQRFDTRAAAVADFLGREPGTANPSPLFDAAFYLRRQPALRETGQNPLVHFLREGRANGLSPRISKAPLGEPPKAPPPEAFGALSPRPAPAEQDPIVDVVVPVYRGFHDTLACLYSVLTARNDTPYELIVIDDQSPEPELSAALRDLARQGLITLYANAENLGFVGSVNRGMTLHGDRDVILLNSDTVVTNDWIDRLRAHAQRDPTIGTLTPWSNNATIMSYPYRNESNSFDLELDFAALDALIADELAGIAVDVPTGVGFCFYIRRALIDEIGIFDADAFGRGYGEENDFCLRAAERRWRNVCAADVFVRHTGEVSFSLGARSAQQIGTTALLARYPGYHALIASFIADDPLGPLRERIDRRRLFADRSGEIFLFVEHTWGGGIRRHTTDLAKLLWDEGHAVLRMTPTATPKIEELTLAGPLDLPNLPKIDISHGPRTAAKLKAWKIGRAHIHSLIGADEDRAGAIQRLLLGSGVPYDFTVHDYAVLCPRITMVDWGGVYCETPSTDYCRVCIEKDGSPFGKVDIDLWRDSYHSVLADARTVLVPDRDVKDRLARYLPDIATVVRPHPETVHLVGRRQQKETGVRTVGVIGAIGVHKGGNVLLELAATAHQHNLPIRFVVFGYSPDRHIACLPNVEMTGPYDEADIDQLIADSHCDFAFFPSVCPETYSYTLTIALRNELYPVAFDLGALASRIRAVDFGQVLPLNLAFDTDALATHLLEMTVDAPPGELALRLREMTRWESSGAYYGKPSPAFL